MVILDGLHNGVIEMSKFISKEDLNMLGNLYVRAQNMPVMTVDCSIPDFASQAADRVRKFQRELGKKYNYDPLTMSISNEGEILSPEEADKRRGK